MMLAETVKREASLFAGKPWGIIVDSRNWELCTPESWAIFEEARVHLSHHGLVCEATVIDKVMLGNLMSENQHSSDVEYGFFKSHEEASAWCKATVMKARET